MKNRTMRFLAIVVLALVAFHAQIAFAAITLNGTVPPGRSGIVIMEQNSSKSSGPIKFKFSAPTAGAYVLAFCIGPAANPCNGPGSVVVSVPGGQERLAVVDASTLANNVLVVVQGTATAIPFSATVE
jgi:hypothetical protein